MADDPLDDRNWTGNGGSGSELPPNVLWAASLSAGLATLLSSAISSLSLPLALVLGWDIMLSSRPRFLPPLRVWCIVQQLRNYRKPILQRFVVRILFMVPKYVQVKPILVIVTVIFKATKTYNDGDLKFTNGYTYVSLAYNFSVSLCLYCLALFWMCTGADLKPFRPMPKFLCIKGVIFFSFWQGFGISILVALGILKSTRYPTETLSLAIQDTLICFEMPIFSILHLYAFSHKDFVEPNVAYCGRLPFVHAFRDSILGFKDVLEDTVMTLRGTGFSYKTFEPAEGALHHQGMVRERRVRAGLRYSAGGKQKYWLPMAGESEGSAYGRKTTADQAPEARNTRWTKFVSKITPGRDLLDSKSGYAPLLPEQAADIIHREGVSASEDERRPLNDHLMGNVGRWDLGGIGYGLDENDSDEGSELDDVSFGEPRREEELLYRDARRLAYGDYNNPVVDASAEEASRLMRAREDGMLANHPAAPSNKKGKARLQGSSQQPAGTSLLHDDEPDESRAGATTPARTTRLSRPSKLPPHSNKTNSHPLPEGCVDLFIEDRGAMEERTRRSRLKGEANRFTGVSPERVFQVLHPDLTTTRTADPTQPLAPAAPAVHMVVSLEDDLQAVQVDQSPSPSSRRARRPGHTSRDGHPEANNPGLETFPTPPMKHPCLGGSFIDNPWDHY